ncbi:hypothetical protein LZ683_08940 [Comamonas testosteroni]|uniref:hypothetical protein n=1 Tax=Comamonas testosteroni TaxID=285 RepID=UPI0023AB45AE|nr:hypothetical protein [Comamonas testosteroni]WEE79467.1 hypothetical protein LZ683_08940 [Comamonas testosteroni]
MDLYRTVAHANAEIAALYADQLKQAAQRDAAPALAPVVVAEPAAAPEPVTEVMPQPVAQEAAPIAVSAEVVQAEDGKPAATRVTVAGIDMSKIGMTKSGSGIDWETLIAHPPFQMFMSEAGFPNPEEKDAANLAADFIIEMSKSKPEMLFYYEYANWFKAKGYWPNETPFGKPLPATAKE